MARPLVASIDKKFAAGSVWEHVYFILGDVSASRDPFAMLLARSDVRVERLVIVNDTAIATDPANHWTFVLTNRGTDGTGVTSLFAVNPTSDSDVAGAQAFAAFDAQVWTPDQNQEVALGAVLSLTITRTGAPADLGQLTVGLEFRQNT